MAILETLRFGLVRWTAERDQFTRVQMDDTHQNIEELVGKFSSGSATPSLPDSEYVRAFFYNTSSEDLLYSHDGVSWSTVVEGVDPVTLTGTETLTNKTFTSPSFSSLKLPGGSQINLYSGGSGDFTYATVNGAETLNVGAFQAEVVFPTLESSFERWITYNSAPGSNRTIEVKTASFHFFDADTTTNFSLNITVSTIEEYGLYGPEPSLLNEALKDGEAITVGVAVKNGATAHYPTSLLIDGNSQSVLWADGSAPTAGNANSIDIYMYLIVKVGNASFKVYGQQNQFA